MSRKRRRHGDFDKFILLALMKEGPLGLHELEKMTSILVSQFEIVGTEFGTRIVSGLFSKLGRPAIVRKNRIKRERNEKRIDIKLECRDLQEKSLIKMDQKERYELSAEGEEKAKEFERGLKKGADII